MMLMLDKMLIKLVYINLANGLFSPCQRLLMGKCITICEHETR